MSVLLVKRNVLNDIGDDINFVLGVLGVCEMRSASQISC